jgi:hypothetical protein
MIEAVVRWWQQRPGAVAAALVGSHARNEARPGSDVDFVLLCRDVQVYLDDTGWLSLFGKPGAVVREAWGDVTSLRVWYPEREVEFGLTSPGWASDPADPGTRSVIQRGIRILYDPEGLLAARVQLILASPAET